MSRTSRDLGIVAVFICLAFVPFMGKAYHIDEPYFLATARHILSDPFHPLAFDFNWYGRKAPMTVINNTPPLMPYALALALKATGGGEFWMRLLFLPLDLLAAVSLYLLARRFLARPLFPVLIALASPAYLINMNHLCTEKLVAAFGFFGLYGLVRGVEEGDRAWYWASAAMLGAAVMAKYGGVLFLLPAACYCRERGVPGSRIVRYLGLALAPLAAYLLWDFLAKPSIFQSVWNTTSLSAAASYSRWPHRLRSFLAFTGGCAVATAVWPFLMMSRRSAAWAVCGAGLAVVLFLPAFDLRSVRGLDRLAGLLFSCGALAALAVFWEGEARASRGWTFWMSWIAAGALLELFVYWSILARLVIFMTIPMTLLMASILELKLNPARLDRIYPASLLLMLALSLPLAAVDFLYARAQKSLAREITAEYAPRGKKVWFTGHWGLQHYMEEAGAEALDWSRGGWDQVRRGDVVVSPQVNSNVLRPERPVFSNVRRFRPACPIPLRLISGWNGQAGFYSSMNGFLPYSLSVEPLEEFSIIEVL